MVLTRPLRLRRPLTVQEVGKGPTPRPSEPKASALNAASHAVLFSSASLVWVLLLSLLGTFQKAGLLKPVTAMRQGLMGSLRSPRCIRINVGCRAWQKPPWWPRDVMKIRLRVKASVNQRPLLGLTSLISKMGIKTHPAYTAGSWDNGMNGKANEKCQFTHRLRHSTLLGGPVCIKHLQLYRELYCISVISVFILKMAM